MAISVGFHWPLVLCSHTTPHSTAQHCSASPAARSFPVNGCVLSEKGLGPGQCSALCSLGTETGFPPPLPILSCPVLSPGGSLSARWPPGLARAWDISPSALSVRGKVGGPERRMLAARSGTLWHLDRPSAVRWREAIAVAAQRGVT